MMPYKRPITLFIRSLFRECDLKEKKGSELVQKIQLTNRFDLENLFLKLG